MKKNEKGKMLSGVMRRPSLTTITNWQSSMKSHICSASTRVWKIILVGFNPYDQTNLTNKRGSGLTTQYNRLIHH